jgi:hypothetical protein
VKELKVYLVWEQGETVGNGQRHMQGVYSTRALAEAVAALLTSPAASARGSVVAYVAEHQVDVDWCGIARRIV